MTLLTRDDFTAILRSTTHQARQRTEWLRRGVAAIRACYKFLNAFTVVTTTVSRAA